MKICWMCRKEQPIKNFYRDADRKNGIGNRCKKCTTKACRKSYYKNRDKIIARKIKYSLANREKIRIKNRKYQRICYERYPEKIKARSISRYAIINGLLAKKPCIKCGNKKSQAHHPDYKKPLLVLWLCSKHHGEIHRKVFHDQKEKN